MSTSPLHYHSKYRANFFKYLQREHRRRTGYRGNIGNDKLVELYDIYSEFESWLKQTPLASQIRNKKNDGTA